MVRVALCLGLFAAIAACASAPPPDPHAEMCAIFAAHSALDPEADLTPEQYQLGGITPVQPLPPGGVVCGDVTYRTDYARGEVVYTALGFTDDRQYAVITYGVWYENRGYMMKCVVGREERSWRGLGCIAGPMT